MIVACCEHTDRVKWGKTKAGTPRFRCKTCGKMITESTEMFGGMRIGLDKAALVVELLCEGNSILATTRIAKVNKRTILDLLLYIGQQCEHYMAENIKGVFVGDCQADEIWNFVLCKKATAKRQKMVGGCGDSYTYTCIDKQTKLLVAWHFGRRNETHTHQFIAKVAQATSGHFHISTDGWRSYQPAIKFYLGRRVDHGIMTKIYGRNIYEDQRRYSPARIIDAVRTPILGTQYADQICTSHVERHNLSIRTHVKRMARLSPCFSKRWDNHRAALALYFCHYNYCRKHSTLKGMTPAMAHGLTTEVWTVRQMLESVTGSN